MLTPGRWTIIRDASPVKRRPSQHGQRRRVVVRCVCGHEAIVYVEDLEGGRSSGCKSHRCAARFDVANQLADELAVNAEDAHRLRARLDVWLLETGRRDRAEMHEALADESDDLSDTTRACVRANHA